MGRYPSPLRCNRRSGGSFLGALINLRSCCCHRPAVEAVILEAGLFLGLIDITDPDKAVLRVPGVGADTVAGQIAVGIVAVGPVLAFHDFVHVVVRLI